MNGDEIRQLEAYSKSFEIISILVYLRIVFWKIYDGF